MLSFVIYALICNFAGVTLFHLIKATKEYISQEQGPLNLVARENKIHRQALFGKRHELSIHLSLSYFILILWELFYNYVHCK